MKKNLNLLIIIAICMIEIAGLLLIDRTGNCRILAYSLIVGFFFLLITIVTLAQKEKASKNILMRLILNLKGEAGSYYGVVSIIFVILNLNWMSDQVFDIWHLDNSNPEYFDTLTINLLRFGYFLAFMIIPFLFPFFGSGKSGSTEKLLVCGLSTPVNFTPGITEEKIIKGLRDAYSKDEKINDYVQFNIEKEIRWGKWDVVRKSLVAHPTINKIFIIISPEIVEFNRMRNKWKDQPNDDLYHDFDIEQLIRRFYKNRSIEIAYSPPIDVNNFDLVKNTLRSTFQLEEYANYKDSEFVFNLTGSTAIVSSAMVLFAMKGERKAEYVHQGTGNLIPINVDVLSVQDLWDEILFKMQERNSGTIN